MKSFYYKNKEMFFFLVSLPCNSTFCARNFLEILTHLINNNNNDNGLISAIYIVFLVF